MNDCFNKLYTEIMYENLGIGPVQFTGQGVDILVRKQKKSTSKKRRFKIKSIKKN